MIKTYFLPVGLRQELRRAWGIPFFGKKEKIRQNFEKFIKKRGLKTIISVGDYCSLNLPSDIKIFDGKVQRKKIKETIGFSLTCSNPAGAIQKEVWPLLKLAIRKKQNVFVKGEEDLLVIPAVLLAEKKTAVVYGFPKKGVYLIVVSPRTKKFFKDLLKRFKS